MLSPDEDFSPVGANSGIKYLTSFKAYKKMLTEDPESTMYKRIFSKFNTSLFGTVSIANNNFVADDGDYESELEQFKNNILIGPPVEDVIDARADMVSPSVSPVPSDHSVSISITSCVSHTTAESSQVSNTVNSSIALPPNYEVEETETPPPNPLKKPGRPLPRKMGAKSSKSTTPDIDANAAVPAPDKRGGRKAKATPVQAPTRVLRGRT